MKNKVIREVKSIVIIIIIAFTLKSTIIEAYIVPTGSMEDTIMTGDFLIGSKFVYGMRTPDWIGIPYTDIGFSLPHFQFPVFREPQAGDVLIFKYPRDVFQKYVKRCVAEPGDTVEIVAKQLFINGEELALSPNGKLKPYSLSPNDIQPDIFLGTQGNRDNFKPLRIPRKGDVIVINTETKWEYLIPVMLMDGHSVTLENNAVKYEFTMFEPLDVIRRKKRTSQQKIMSQYYPNGQLLTPWSNQLSYNSNQVRFLHIDGKPISNWAEYVVEQDYYWMMGDNRDDSADSRYWGFVPRSYILGEALFSYMSINFKTWLPRLNRIGVIIR